VRDIYIGLMSGTSADGVDAVLIEFTREGDKHSGFHILHAIDIPYRASFRKQLLKLALSPSCDKALLATVSGQLADLFVEAVERLLQESKFSADQIVAIGSHGHTIDHAPNNPLPYTLQITDHARLVEKTGINVVCDFRSRDIAAEGQGAPLVPAFHQWLFTHQTVPATDSERAIINIGGISNLTLVNAGLGFDCGPGNCLIDYWHQLNTGENFDYSGESARKGQLIPELLNAMLEDPYFSQQAPKSTGREYFNQEWLNPKLELSNNRWQDTAFTLTVLTARIIADQINFYNCQEVFLCGGGSHNTLLIEQIEQFAPGVSLKTTADLGIAPDWVEAAAFAWLARQTLNNLPGNLPSATGAKGERILGAIYPA